MDLLKSFIQEAFKDDVAVYGIKDAQDRAFQRCVGASMAFDSLGDRESSRLIMEYADEQFFA